MVVDHATAAAQLEVELDRLKWIATEAAIAQGIDAADCSSILNLEDGSCTLMVGDRPFAVITMDDETFTPTLRFFAADALAKEYPDGC